MCFLFCVNRFQWSCMTHRARQQVLKFLVQTNGVLKQVKHLIRAVQTACAVTDFNMEMVVGLQVIMCLMHFILTLLVLIRVHQVLQLMLYLGELISYYQVYVFLQFCIDRRIELLLIWLFTDSCNRCSTSQTGDLTKSDTAVNGIFGFGQNGLSIISQLSSQGVAPKAFSHCLIGSDKGGGILVFGQITEPNMVYTPLVQSQ